MLVWLYEYGYENIPTDPNINIMICYPTLRNGNMYIKFTFDDDGNPILINGHSDRQELEFAQMVDFKIICENLNNFGLIPNFLNKYLKYWIDSRILALCNYIKTEYLLKDMNLWTF
ncbi:MAG: hypothetical protein LBM96_08475 [Methanobrevibacter sp.]|nr:hypothetical protein [Candidatus Methanoflexus mossambicus]